MEAGGRSWLESFLELPRLGLLSTLTPHVVVPPDVRATLNVEDHRDHPLRSLLCPLADAACGAETSLKLVLRGGPRACRCSRPRRCTI
jgi:hypothetical protein